MWLSDKKLWQIFFGPPTAEAADAASTATVGDFQAASSDPESEAKSQVIQKFAEWCNNGEID